MKLMACAVVAMSMLAGAAQAGDWREVGGNEDSTTFIDVASLRRSGQNTTAWVAFVYLKSVSDGVDYTMLRTEFSCSSGMMRMVHVYRYRANGSLVRSYPMPEPAMTAPPPDSVGEAFVRGACENDYADSGFDTISGMFTEERRAAARSREKN